MSKKILLLIVVMAFFVASGFAPVKEPPRHTVTFIDHHNQAIK